MIPKERLMKQKEKIFVFIQAKEDNLIVSRFSGDGLYAHIKNHFRGLLDETFTDNICDVIFSAAVSNVLLSYANRFKFVVIREK